MKKLKSWVDYEPSSDFSIYNIPFGIARSKTGTTFTCSAIGDHIINLDACFQSGLLSGTGVTESSLRASSLNSFIALGKKVTKAVRERIQEILTEGNSAELQRDDFLLDRESADLLLPVEIGDYTDFYSSIEHATNVGKMFRDPENALLPNWRHLPVGYHGRASSIVVSGTPVKRPKGQQKPDDGPPVFGPCKLMDFELEMGFIIGKDTELGSSVSTSEAEDHIFGLILFNDWSARDIQKWEYVPLGPFLAKNFASTVSPWIITLEALEPFRVQGPKQDPEVLPYLKFTGAKNYNVDMDVILRTESGTETLISHSNFSYMYWNMCQQLAHHTVNGCNIRVGDLYASGTISGHTPDSYGSMLELSWQGKKPIQLNDGTSRKFLLDNDTVIMRAYCEKDGMRVGFGEAAGKIVPSE